MKPSMRHSNLEEFLKNDGGALANGPVALIFVEDFVEVDSTIRHHQKLGFRSVVVFAPDQLALSEELEQTIHRVSLNTGAQEEISRAINKVIAATPGLWLYYCYNAEYLFYPFCESRTISEMLAFHTEERRDAVLGYVVDLYAGDLSSHPDAVSLDQAFLDQSGYYALARTDKDTGHPKERQLDFFGGLRWRFEEHIPEPRRRIDRIPLFRAKPGLELGNDHLFNDEEYNTYSCPWHHNITVSIASFRTAKALKANSGSTFDIGTFKWHNSTKFGWNSKQLLDLGLMEPGQWF